MAATSDLKLTFNFADETARNLTLGSFATLTANDVRTRVKNFNNNIASYGDLYLSDGGATCSGVTAATIVSTTETEINLNDE